MVRVLANNDAGATECVLKFSTKPYIDSNMLPVPLIRKFTALPIYNRMYFLIPLTSAIVCLAVMSVAVALFCCQCRRATVYQSDHRIAIKAMAEEALLKKQQKDDTLDNQIYIPDPGQMIRFDRNRWQRAKRRQTEYIRDNVDNEQGVEDMLATSDTSLPYCSHLSLNLNRCTG